MKRLLFLAVAITSLHAAAAERSGEFAAGTRYYEAAEFGKAATRFRLLCNAEPNAEACYWAGLSYERLADTRAPYGCRTAAKAQPFFDKAMVLSGGRPLYRDALFEFLLNNAECSRASLWEAAGILATVPESDPDYDRMRTRLIDADQGSRSLETRLSNLFLALPRATYRVAALPGALVSRKTITPPASPQTSPTPPLPREAAVRE